MDNRICPSCGSAYFMLSKTDKSSAFQVSESYEIEYLEPQSMDHAQTENHAATTICCAACSWKGKLENLVESHTG